MGDCLSAGCNSRHLKILFAASIQERDTVRDNRNRMGGEWVETWLWKERGDVTRIGEAGRPIRSIFAAWSMVEEGPSGDRKTGAYTITSTAMTHGRWRSSFS